MDPDWVQTVCKGYQQTFDYSCMLHRLILVVSLALVIQITAVHLARGATYFVFFRFNLFD